MDLVSVIVPIYNVEKYLYKCLESIINQTYKNLEIILVNDGSTDKSVEICNEFLKKDSRIKLINKKNGGLSDARNVGIDKATGEYIVFIDSDDWIEYNMIEILYRHSIKYNADIVQGDYVKTYNEEIKINNTYKEEINIYNSKQMLENLCDNKRVKDVVVWNKLYRASLFNNIKFPKGKLHEDEFTTYKLYDKSNIIVDTNICIYFYRQREGSIMSSDFSIKRLDVLSAWKERSKYFEERGLKELSYKTQTNLCQYLKIYYLRVNKSSISNKQVILKSLKNEMRKSYVKFIKNKYITLRGKATLTLCILNGTLFCKIYDKHLSK